MTAQMRLSGDCPRCNSPLVRRVRRKDSHAFISCSGYPKCNFAEDIDEHIDSLASEVAELRVRLEEAESRIKDFRSRKQHTTPDTDRLFKKLISIAHPDRWSQGQLATELATTLTATINDIRKSTRKV